MRIGILAGETSGDLLGAKLIQALREKKPDLQFEGIGGSAMIAAGCNSLFDMERLSVMGLIEPLKRLPDLIKLRRDLYHHFTREKPDLFIGIDSPEFNLGLELKLRRLGIPVVHYVSPSVWAWRQRRIYKIKKAVDLMLTLFPFEARFYEEHHVPVRYVGHPLAAQIPLEPDTHAARRALSLDEHQTYIALLPGSRRQEIRFMAEPFLLAAKELYAKAPHLQFITSHVNEERYQAFYAVYQKLAPEIPLHFFTQRSGNVMAAADVIVVTSGTATLEAMLYKKPMVIGYRLSKPAYWLAKKLVKTPFIGLPNLLANRALVPELIQEKLTPEAIASHVLSYLNHPEDSRAIQASFREIHQTLLSASLDDAVNSILLLAK